MSQHLNEFCDRWLAAWTGNRPEALIDFYTPDAFYSDPAMSKGLQGRDAILPYLTKLLAKNPDWVWQRAELHPYSDGFFLKWQATVPTGDNIVHCNGLDLVQMRDGKIARNEVYFDPTPIVGGSRRRAVSNAGYSPLEFWFDFASTYSYLTAMRIERKCQEAGKHLIWRPFLLGPIFKDHGWSTSPFNLFPAEGNYMWKEMERHSRAYGLSKYRKPTEFPRNGLLAARIAIEAKDEPWIGEFIKYVFRANFEDDRDIADKQVIAQLLEKAGTNAQEWLARSESSEAKAGLREQTERARNLGIFGAPSFLTGNELFWGDDRLEEACGLKGARP